MGRPDQAILMDDVTCTGGELALHSCSRVLDNDCDHSEDAGVICSGKMWCKFANSSITHTQMHIMLQEYVLMEL